MVMGTLALETQVLSASIRNSLHFLESARVGAHVATIPYSIFDKLVSHPQTDLGIESFLADWKKVPGGGNVEELVKAWLDRRSS